MSWLVFLDIFILLYHLTNAKPVTPTQKTSSTELIREKRGELEDDEGTDEMQKFILDLSAKEDMRRLNERFRTVIPRNIESDVEYRRLKRFSIHDTGDRHDESSSGKVIMEMRSSRTSREDEDITSPETSPSLQTSKRSTEPNIPSQERRSNGILVQVLSKRNSGIKDNRAAEPSNSENVQGSKSNEADKNSEVSDLEKNDLNKNFPSYKNSEIIDNKSPAKDNRDVDGPEFGNEFNNLNSGRSESSEDNAVNPTAGSHINHHLVGDSWELVHHDARSTTGSLPSLTSANNALHSSSNTTMHREYLNDDVIDDVVQYKRTKLRRKPRLSKIRVVRSIEPEYEVQEISAVYNGKSDSPDENSARVIALDNRPIKRDGYIGCFVDQHPNRDLIKSFSISSLTPDSCRLVCKQKGHAYAGVQYGYLCHCGDDYGKYGYAGEGECNSVCQGDEDKKCGGFWRNSIYAADIFPKDEDGENSKRESRSHIDRIIPITESEENEEAPVRQEITAYLRVHIPQRPDQTISTQTGRLSQKSASSATAASSKRTETPSPKSNRIDQVAYLHPQNIHRSFIPSNIVLKKLKPVPGKKTYTGTVKLKQNWHDNLKNKKSPKTLILAGNIESAFREMFATDHDFEKAEVLGFREAAVRNDPSTVHKVLVEFALTFRKVGIGKDEKLREMVDESSRLDDMPVFGNTIQVKEYTEKEEQDFTSNESKGSDEEVPKDTREAPYENQLEDDKQNGVDPFLEKVFSQI